MPEDLTASEFTRLLEYLKASRGETRGQAFLDLDIGLPVRELRQPLRECLDGGTPAERTVVLDGVNRRGKPIECQVQCMPLLSGERSVGVIVLVDQTEHG